MRKFILFLLMILLCGPAMAATQVKKTVCPAGQGCDYTTLNDAVGYFKTNYPDFTSSDIYGTIEISGDWSSGADTTGVEVSGITTDATRFLEIYTVGQAVHSGKWDTNAYRMEIAQPFGAALSVKISNLYITGIQVKNTSYWLNESCTGYPRGIVKENDSTTNVNIKNCIVISNEDTIIKRDYAGNLTVTNSIAISNCGTAISGFSSGITTIYNSVAICLASCNAFEGGSGTMNVYNSYGYSLSGLAYNNINILTSSASSDTTGSEGLQEIAYSTSSGTYFTNVTPGSEDFHITNTSSSLYQAGTDLSATFTDDIDGDTRTTWDIGVDYIATGGEPPASGSTQLTIDGALQINGAFYVN